MQSSLNRRDALKAGGFAACASLGLASSVQAQSANAPQPSFSFALNTSTLRGHKLALDREIDLIAKAGYDGFEPWVSEIANYQEAGGDLRDLEKRIDDHGLKVYGAIAFSNWIVDDDAKRAAGLERAKRDMDMLRRIGGTHIAAPPAGATRQENLDLLAAAERYRALLELGDQMGVIPAVEIWGFSKSLARLGEAVFVAIESGRPDACLLPDVYHIYKGGSDFHGLKLVNGRAVPALHMNDYPADPPRAAIGDADRVYPGDGVAPIGQILRDLREAGFQGALSLELFNPKYWERDPFEVAKTGLAKMRAEVQKVFA